MKTNLSASLQMPTRDNRASGIRMAWPRFLGSSIHPFFSWVFKPRLRASHCVQCWEFPTSERVSPQLMCSVTWRRPHSAFRASASAALKQRSRPGAKKHFRHGRPSAGSEPAESCLPRLGAGQEGSLRRLSAALSYIQPTPPCSIQQMDVLALQLCCDSMTYDL